MDAINAAAVVDGEAAEAFLDDDEEEEGEEEEVEAVAASGRVTKITPEERRAVHKHFDDVAAEQWTVQDRHEGFKKMIGEVAKAEGKIYARLSVSQLLTQWNNFNAKIMKQNKCGERYYSLTEDLQNDRTFLLRCAIDMCAFVYDMFSKSHNLFQVLPTILCSFLGRVAAQQDLMDNSKTLDAAFADLTTGDRRQIDGLVNVLKYGCLYFYQQMWREVVTMENSASLFAGRPDLEVADLDFRLWLARFIARSDISSNLSQAFIKGSFVGKYLVDISGHLLYNHQEIDEPTKRTFPPYMAEAIAGDPTSYTKLIITALELRFYSLYKRKLMIGHALFFKGKDDPDDDDRTTLTELRGGMKAVTAYRAGAAVYAAMGTIVPRESMLTVGKQEKQGTLDNAQFVAEVRRTFTTSMTIGEYCQIPLELFKLKGDKAMLFVPDPRLYAQMILLEIEIFQLVLTDTQLVVAMGQQYLIGYLRSLMESHSSYQIVGKMFDEAVRHSTPPPDSSWVAEHREKFVNRYWSFYFDGSISRDIQDYFRQLIDPNADPMRKLAFRVKVLTDKMKEDTTDWN